MRLALSANLLSPTMYFTRSLRCSSSSMISSVQLAIANQQIFLYCTHLSGFGTFFLRYRIKRRRAARADGIYAGNGILDFKDL